MSAKVDLICPGQKFGRWTVLDEYTTMANGRKKWLCRCECGTERYVRTQSLRNGDSKSCGCLKPEKIKQDLAGKRYGKLTVLEYDKAVSKWKCQCDCGNITYKTTGHLNAGAVSCGCVQKQDLTGTRFGKLIVLGRKEGDTAWLCQCDCGNICEKPTGQLNAGTAMSCGCSWRQPAVHEGERYGRLTALRATEQREARSVVWECQCDCGVTTMVRATMLTSGHTTSCGCVKREIDEERDFKKILTYTDDTCIEFAKNIGKPKANTSPDTGVRGVVLKDGKYVAQIRFQKKYHYLGRYSRLEDAVKARRRAEQRVEEYVEAYLSGNSTPEPIEFN